MKVLVFAHHLEVGGTQTNAIELAAALRDRHGFEIVLFATPGPMVALAREKGLRYLPAPETFVHPSPSRIVALEKVIRRERPDVIHAWDWWQCVDAFYCAHLLRRIPLLVTDMMMNLTTVLPQSLPTTFGTPEIADQARAAGWRRAALLLPPVDTEWNAPGIVDAEAFRKQYDIRDDELTLVTVSRLERSMKGDSVRGTIAAVRALHRELPLRLILVGDGKDRSAIQQLADEANAEIGRPAVILVGTLLDPRPAYAAASIVIGMGGSALRGMAFGKPVIVVGGQGFSLPFNAETEPWLYYHGMYGIGVEDPNYVRHTEDIRRLAAQAAQFPALGEFSRQFVLRHFALDAVAAQLATSLREAAAQPVEFRTAAIAGMRTAALLIRQRKLLSYRFWYWLTGWRSREAK